MISVQDMTELLYIRDAYNELNRALFGNKRALGLHEGNFGSLSRIYGLIERNASEELKKNNYSGVWKIADDTSITPEERAKLLLME